MKISQIIKPPINEIKIPLTNIELNKRSLQFKHRHFSVITSKQVKTFSKEEETIATKLIKDGIDMLMGIKLPDTKELFNFNNLKYTKEAFPLTKLKQFNDFEFYSSKKGCGIHVHIDFNNQNVSITSGIEYKSLYQETLPSKILGKNKYQVYRLSEYDPENSGKIKWIVVENTEMKNILIFI